MRDDILHILADYRAGDRLNAMALRYGCSVSTITKEFRAIGEPPRNTPPESKEPSSLREYLKTEELMPC